MHNEYMVVFTLKKVTMEFLLEGFLLLIFYHFIRKYVYGFSQGQLVFRFIPFISLSLIH